MMKRKGMFLFAVLCFAQLSMAGKLEELLAERGAAAKVAGWYAMMRPHKGKVMATYHRSLTYLADRFCLLPDIQLEPKPGIPPTAKHLAAVVDEMKARDVKVIAQAPYYQTKAAKLVSSRTGAQLLIIAFQTGGAPEATGYLSMLDNSIRKLAEAL